MDEPDFFRKKRVFVTGHTGFKGTWLSQMLVNLSAEVIGYALEPNTKPNMFEAIGLQTKIKNYFSDIRDYEKLLAAIKSERPDILIHMAAQPLVRDSYEDPIYTYQTNVMGTVNVLHAIKETDCVKSAVIVTTDKVYENKETKKVYKETDELGGYDPYSASKACTELVTQSYIRSFFNPTNYGIRHNTFIATARAGNVIGGGDWSRDRLVPDIVRAIMERKERVVIRNPNATRPWQHVLDPLGGYLLLARGLYNGNKKAVGAWNFGPKEKGIAVEEVVKKAIELMGTGGYVVKEDKTKHEMQTLALDATKAKKELQWKPALDFNKSVEWTFDWYREFYSNGKINATELTYKQINEFLKGKGG